jgi:hypothetical protein
MPMHNPKVMVIQAFNFSCTKCHDLILLTSQGDLNVTSGEEEILQPMPTVRLITEKTFYLVWRKSLQHSPFEVI